MKRMWAVLTGKDLRKLEGEKIWSMSEKQARAVAADTARYEDVETYVLEVKARYERDRTVILPVKCTEPKT